MSCRISRCFICSFCPFSVLIRLFMFPSPFLSCTNSFHVFFFLLLIAKTRPNRSVSLSFQRYTYKSLTNGQCKCITLVKTALFLKLLVVIAIEPSFVLRFPSPVIKGFEQNDFKKNRAFPRRHFVIMSAHVCLTCNNNDEKTYHRARWIFHFFPFHHRPPCIVSS